MKASNAMSHFQILATSALAVFALLAWAPASHAQSPECDSSCLESLTEQYLQALLQFEGMQLPPAWPSLPWAERVRSTENDVAIMIGEGVWGTTTLIEPGFTLADPATGNVLWLGVIEEHGDSAYMALRLGVEGREIAEVETIVGRAGTPGDYAPSSGYRVDAVFSQTIPEQARVPRARMIALVEGYYNTMQLNDGVILSEIADDCRRVSNGVATTHREGQSVTGCRQQFEIGLYKPVDRVRSRRFPIVDEERGIVVAIAYLDHAARYVNYTTLDGQEHSIAVEYPNSHAVLELFRIRDGEIQRVEGVSVFQPYLMPTIWTH